jgi:hypothetical protein
MTTTTSITGAGSFTRPSGRLVNASYPLVAAELSDEGFGIGFRTSLLNRLRLAPIPSGTKSAHYYVTWEKIQLIEKGPRSVVIWGEDGNSCRFAVGFPSKLNPILKEAEDRGIQVQRVRSTLNYWFHRAKKMRGG